MTISIFTMCAIKFFWINNLFKHYPKKKQIIKWYFLWISWVHICWSAKLTLNHNGSNIKYCWHWINVLHSTNYLREIWHSAFFTSGDYDIMVWQICRFSLRVNFPGSEFFFWRQSSFLGKFAVSNYPGALFPDGKIAPGKFAPDSVWPLPTPPIHSSFSFWQIY